MIEPSVASQTLSPITITFAFIILGGAAIACIGIIYVSVKWPFPENHSPTHKPFFMIQGEESENESELHDRQK